MLTVTRHSLIVAALCVLCSQSGCILLSKMLGQRKGTQLDTSLLEAQGYSIPPGGMPTQVSPDPNGKPRVVLEIRNGDDERHIESIPLQVDQGLFIQDVVQDASLHKSFGALHISIMRPSAGGPPVRMDLNTDDDGNVSSTGQNYALLPGDHVIVIEDQRSALEKFISEQFM